ncbi:MAG: hypothetical protein ABII00_01585 [Elusimicrobiota bacterium]
MTALDYLVCGVHMACVLGIGVYPFTKNKDSEDYCVGGRSRQKARCVYRRDPAFYGIIVSAVVSPAGSALCSDTARHEETADAR